MDSKLEREMTSYYDERAEEYDEIYAGKGPAIPVPNAYKGDVAEISEMVSAFGTGHLIDIGCGTGFWLPYYEGNCSKVTLIDQSERMLSVCRKRANEMGVQTKCRFIRGDFFAVALEDHLFDSAIVGFFLSHLSLERERTFFEKLRSILRPGAPLMVIDSAWSRKRERHRRKEGIQERILKNGRTFTIYKRYFNRSDLEGMLERYSFGQDSFHIGDVFLAVVGEKYE